MALKDVIGQERAIKVLRGCMQRNRIAHAYLFAGDEGIGKKFTAINFAKTLNCQKTRDASSKMRDESNNSHYASRITHYEIDCCDECPSCIKINKSIHPDYYLITPESGEIKVDTIRELMASLSYKAFEGGRKIVIIDAAEKLNQSAANAFLKTLEEPPEQSVLILVSSFSGLIPETIISRCQKIHFSPLPLHHMHALLGNKFSSAETALISMLSGGRPGWALADNLIEKRDSLFEDFKNLISTIQEDLAEDKDSLEEWFEWAQLWLRDIAVLKATDSAAFLINHDREKEIREISHNVRLHDILRLSGTLYNIKSLLRFNLNKKITLNHTHFLLRETFGG